MNIRHRSPNPKIELRRCARVTAKFLMRLGQLWKVVGWTTNESGLPRSSAGSIEHSKDRGAGVLQAPVGFVQGNEV